MQLSISNQCRRPLFTFCLFRLDRVEWCKRTPLSTTTRRGYAHLAALGILLANPSATHSDSSRRKHALIVQVVLMRLHHHDHMDNSHDNNERKKRRSDGRVKSKTLHICNH
jgi:hypothetical protein